jgi:hypothetical protein
VQVGQGRVPQHRVCTARRAQRAQRGVSAKQRPSSAFTRPTEPGG